MITQTLGRSRHLRLNQLHDDALQRIARQEGCSVSDLLRRAAIQVFSLPTEDTNSGEVVDTVAPMPEQHSTNGAASPSGETPTTEVAS